MNLLLTALFNLRRQRAPHRRVFVLLDQQGTIDTAEVFRYLKPWQSWVSIVGVANVDRESAATAFVQPIDRLADVVLCLSNDGIIKAVARAACRKAGVAFVDARLPAKDSRELALLQEVLHHDFELGGFNEWAGKDPQFSAPVLRSLSATHCVRSFPAYVAGHLGELWGRNGGQPLQVLDIGCGAVSRLRWGALQGLCAITGVDPLLDMYAIVRERHGYNALPEIRCTREVCAGAEALAGHFAPQSFDAAYCANALDHTEDPVAVVESVAPLLRPGGIFAIDVYTREGSRENWWQLHQFDMYVTDAGDFVAETRDGVVRSLVPPGSGFRIRQIAARHETTAVILERVADISAARKTA